jgi:hypothetical protein
MKLLAGAKVEQLNREIIPWNEIRYAAFAEKYGWHPRQVDELTIAEEDWILEIAHLMGLERVKREKQAAEVAERRRKKGLPF